MPQVIGICGKKFSGKSTLARQIAEGRDVAYIPFAYPLKLGLVAMGLPAEILFTPELKEIPHPLLQGRTPRHAMVTLGTEWGRDMIGPFFWIDLWTRACRTSKHELIIVDDVRFPEEIAAVRAVSGQVIAVEKLEAPPSWWKRLTSKAPHRSESLRYSDYNIPVLLNDGTPAELLEKFRAISRRGT